MPHGGLNLLGGEGSVQQLQHFLGDVAQGEEHRRECAGAGIVDDLVDDAIQSPCLIEDDLKIGATGINRIGIVEEQGGGRPDADQRISDLMRERLLDAAQARLHLLQRRNVHVESLIHDGPTLLVPDRDSAAEDLPDCAVSMQEAKDRFIGLILFHR